jgi:hypothetical protein
MAAGAQAGHERTADEPGRAGYRDLHALRRILVTG